MMWGRPRAWITYWLFSASSERARRTPTEPYFVRTAHDMLGTPLNIPKWLEKNKHLLQPPINNYCVYNDDVTVMIVGGPNSRTDYHINETAEWFYQYKGTMLLKVIDDGAFRDIYIEEGSMFLLPPNTPHNPVRFANTIGIVLEQKRPKESLDKLRWYCPNLECRSVVDEQAFHCTDLGTQIKAGVEAFGGSLERRTCKKCGTVAETKPKEGEIRDPNVEE